MAGEGPPLPPLTKSASQQSIDEGISWFHGKITRDVAEELLKASGTEEGLFLVRESTSSQGDYVLSLIYNQAPIHYQIRRHGEDAFFSIDDGPVVHGLEMLIAYYQEDAQGLFTKLGKMCKGQPPPHETRRHGRTNLLHRATKEGNSTVVRELLKSGYHNLDAKNQEGQTAVHLASILGLNDILTYLLKAGANPNVLDSNGLSPLHYACQNNQHETVRVLLANGTNPQLRASMTGWVPLHDAASRGHLVAVQILLDHESPHRPRSDFNETPYDLAVKNNQKDCAEMLAKHTPRKPKLTKADWFHKKIDREGAYQLLHDKGLTDGSFLVRRSSRTIGMYVLTMVHASHVYNYEIQCQGQYYFIDDGPYLDSLEHLVQHYSTFADGLPTKLLVPVSQDKNRSADFKCVDKENSNSDSIYDNIQELKNALPPPPLPPPNPKEKQRPNLIRRDSLRIDGTVGEGEFGSVLKGKWMDAKNSQVDVAIKKLRDENLQSSREEFTREVEVMAGLDHPCIVKLLGVCLGPPLMMVQELVSMGSLLDFVLDYPEQVDKSIDMFVWSAQIAWGMTYLEEERFVHRDLALRNILLSSKLQAKITDFGLSRALGAGSAYYKASSGGKWPLKWYAPESINYGTFSHASDVWSYGITLWEIFSFGEPPYGDMNGTQVLQLLENNKRLSKPGECPQEMYTVMQNCWQYDPDKRPTFREIYEMFCTDPAFVHLRKHFTAEK